MNNHPPNHPLYNTLGQPNVNIQLLDNVFTAGAVQAAPAATGVIVADQAAKVQYYAAPAEMNLAAAAPPHGGHTAVNLAQPAHVVSTADVQPAGVTTVVYQTAAQEQQQQPISYKVPAAQVTSASTSASATASAPVQQQQQQPQPEKKKDIVAEATSKIFDEDAAKKSGPVPVSQSSTASSGGGPVTAVKSEPGPGPSGGPVRQGGPVSVGRPRGGPRGGPRGRGRGGGRGGRGRGASAAMAMNSKQHILPRLQLLEEEDDGLTCRMCLQSFWYKSQLIDHLKASHSVTDPERYEREEREKKMRRIREDQQRQIMAKRQKMGPGGRMMRSGRGRMGPGGRPIGPPKPAGPRPSFQYRDGAFICDLCKKSFSDGNDMVTHWKSHVKKQRLDGGGPRGGRRGRGRRPPSPGFGRRRRRGVGGVGVGGRGRPVSSGRGRGRGRGGRSDKGVPRWTAYLVWSTRRRKEIAKEGEGLSFGEVAKAISAEWKQVSEEEKARFQEEAEDMNERGVRKIRKEPRDSDENSSDSWSSDSDDPTFEELERLERKPIVPRIKKEGAEGEEEEDEEGGIGYGDERPRSTRKRKRPSFFQEFENEENNLDKILDEFEQEQIEEAKKPKPEKPKPTPRPEGSTRRRRRKQIEIMAEEEEMMGPKEPVELEKSRSGRIRKKTKFQDYFQRMDDEIGGEELSSGEPSDDGEFQPDDSEPDEPEEEFVEEEEEEDDERMDEGDEDDFSLPPKKRKGSGKVMTDAEIEEATRQALSAKPMVLLDQMNSDEDEADENVEAKRKKLDEVAGEETSSGKPAWITEEVDDVESKSKGEEQSEAPEAQQEERAKADDKEEAADAASKDAAEEPSTEASEAQSSEPATESREQAAQEEPEKEASASPPSEEVPSTAAEGEGKEDEQEQEEAQEDPSPPADDVTEGAPVEAVASDTAVPSAPEEEEEEAPSAPEPAEEKEEEKEEGADADAATAQSTSAATEEAAAAVGDDSAADLLASTSADRMEEGDDKFKDIIAEGQIDNIFN